MDLLLVFLSALVGICCCVCMGRGIWSALYRKESVVSGATDALLTGEILMIGLAGTAHLGAVFLGRSFSDCVKFFCILLGAALALSVFVILCSLTSPLWRENRKKPWNLPGAKASVKTETSGRVMACVFILLALAQLIWIAANGGTYRQGDMTVETVGSFLCSDGIYKINPMTGQAYSQGIPLRLKILCLPTLYGIFCRLSGLTPDRVVYTVIPLLTAVSSYAAFDCVGKCLFPDSAKKRYCFLITIVILTWSGSGLYGMDGFNLLYCGSRGVAVRGLVLLPYLVSLCLRRRWKPVLLCILAEVCITWTLYGLGAGLFLAAGLFLSERCGRKFILTGREK